MTAAFEGVDCLHEFNKWIVQQAIDGFHVGAYRMTITKEMYRGAYTICRIEVSNLVYCRGKLKGVC